MEIPSFCRKSVSLDNSKAGWWVHNSTRLVDLVPDWRMPGGGVCADELTELPEALDKAISLTKQRIADAENHLRKLFQILLFQNLYVCLLYPQTNRLS